MRPHAAAVVALALTAAPAAAQFIPGEVGGPDPSETSAWLALTMTPVGAFPEVAGTTSSRGVGVRFLFGNMDEEGDVSRRSFGLGLEIPTRGATLGFTAGMQDVVCPDDENYGFFRLEYDCRTVLMGGASLDFPLVTGATNAQGTGLALGLQLTAGYGTSEELLGLTMDDGTTQTSFTFGGHGMSATIGLPMSLIARSGGMSIVPYVTPRFGWGRATMKFEDTTDPSANDEQTESGTRFILGGGLTVNLENGLGLTAGFQKVFIEDGASGIGFSVLWRP